MTGASPPLTPVSLTGRAARTPARPLPLRRSATRLSGLGRPHCGCRSSIRASRRPSSIPARPSTSTARACGSTTIAARRSMPGAGSAPRAAARVAGVLHRPGGQRREGLGTPSPRVRRRSPRRSPASAGRSRCCAARGSRAAGRSAGPSSKTLPHLGVVLQSECSRWAVSIWRSPSRTARRRAPDTTAASSAAEPGIVVRAVGPIGLLAGRLPGDTGLHIPYPISPAASGIPEGKHFGVPQRVDPGEPESPPYG